MDSRMKVTILAKSIAVVLLGGSVAFGGVAHADAPVVTRYTYDLGNNIVNVTDPRGLITSYAHDGLDQVWRQASPDTGVTTFSYDGYGRRASMTRADGTQTTYGYDGINRPVSISAGGHTQSFSYDTCTGGVGRLCAASDATGTTSYAYTQEGWISHRSVTMAGVTYALGYGYDAMGHLTKVNYPDGNQAIYTYASGVVASVAYKIGGTTVTGASAITYRPMDAAMATWTSSNSLVNTASYDTDGRLTGISVPGVQSLGFSYDAADRIIEVGNGIHPGYTQSFGYDAMSRLVSVYSGADSESFQYDANGNRLAQTGVLNAFSATSNRLVSSGTTQYGYDAKGNTTTVNAAPTYHYDAFNRMDGAGGMTYYVNPEGQRMRKSGAVGTTYFAYGPGGALLAENVNGAWVDYVWLNGRLIGRIANGQTYAVHADQTGRPETVTDASRTVVWQAQNLAFTRNVTKANITLNIGFPGQYYDAETDKWSNGYRDYDARLGRYVESDPIGLMGGVNTYAYVDGNPLIHYDPYGLWAWGDPVPQALVDYSAGFGDGASLGLTSLVRDAMGTNDKVDKCSTAYGAGGWSSFTLGAGRVAYAGLAKVGAAAMASGAEASAFRSALRRAFGGGNSFRPPNLSKYATDDALRAAAGRTNAIGNAWGAGAAAAGAYEGSGSTCGC